MKPTNPNGGLTLSSLFGDETPPKWGENLLRFLGGQFRSQQEALQARLTVRDNLAWDYKEAFFDHGVALSLLCSRVKAPKGALILGADGQSIDSWKVQPSSIAGQVKVTIWFRDTTAKAVKVGLYILPDGTASGA